MLHTVRNPGHTGTRRRREAGQGGFSLIELVIVVVIFGVLIAIAIPVFLSIQDRVGQGAADTAAANAATQWVIAQANGQLPDFGDLAPAVVTGPVDDATLSDFCLSATLDGKTGYAGPGVMTAADGTRSCP